VTRWKKQSDEVARTGDMALLALISSTPTEMKSLRHSSHSVRVQKKGTVVAADGEGAGAEEEADAEAAVQAVPGDLEDVQFSEISNLVQTILNF
jgi:hypothetical protein